MTSSLDHCDVNNALEDTSASSLSTEGHGALLDLGIEKQDDILDIFSDVNPTAYSSKGEYVANTLLDFGAETPSLNPSQGDDPIGLNLLDIAPSVADTNTDTAVLFADNPWPKLEDKSTANNQTDDLLGLFDSLPDQRLLQNPNQIVPTNMSSLLNADTQEKDGFTDLLGTEPAKDTSDLLEVTDMATDSLSMLPSGLEATIHSDNVKNSTEPISNVFTSVLSGEIGQQSNDADIALGLNSLATEDMFFTDVQPKPLETNGNTTTNDALGHLFELSSDNIASKEGAGKEISGILGGQLISNSQLQSKSPEGLNGNSQTAMDSFHDVTKNTADILEPTQPSKGFEVWPDGAAKDVPGNFTPNDAEVNIQPSNQQVNNDISALTSDPGNPESTEKGGPIMTLLGEGSASMCLPNGNETAMPSTMSFGNTAEIFSESNTFDESNMSCANTSVMLDVSSIDTVNKPDMFDGISTIDQSIGQLESFDQPTASMGNCVKGICPTGNDSPDVSTHTNPAFDEEAASDASNNASESLADAVDDVSLNTIDFAKSTENSVDNVKLGDSNSSGAECDQNADFSEETEAVEEIGLESGESIQTESSVSKHETVDVASHWNVELEDPENPVCDATEAVGHLHVLLDDNTYETSSIKQLHVSAAAEEKGGGDLGQTLTVHHNEESTKSNEDHPDPSLGLSQVAEEKKEDDQQERLELFATDNASPEGKYTNELLPAVSLIPSGEPSGAKQPTKYKLLNDEWLEETLETPQAMPSEAVVLNSHDSEDKELSVSGDDLQERLSNITLNPPNKDVSQADAIKGSSSLDAENAVLDDNALQGNENELVNVEPTIDDAQGRDAAFEVGQVTDMPSPPPRGRKKSATKEKVSPETRTIVLPEGGLSEDSSSNDFLNLFTDKQGWSKEHDTQKVEEESNVDESVIGVQVDFPVKCDLEESSTMTEGQLPMEQSILDGGPLIQSDTATFLKERPGALPVTKYHELDDDILAEVAGNDTVQEVIVSEQTDNLNQSPKEEAELNIFGQPINEQATKMEDEGGEDIPTILQENTLIGVMPSVKADEHVPNNSPGNVEEALVDADQGKVPSPPPRGRKDVKPKETPHKDPEDMNFSTPDANVVEISQNAAMSDVNVSTLPQEDDLHLISALVDLNALDVKDPENEKQAQTLFSLDDDEALLNKSTVSVDPIFSNLDVTHMASSTEVNQSPFESSHSPGPSEDIFSNPFANDLGHHSDMPGTLLDVSALDNVHDIIGNQQESIALEENVGVIEPGLTNAPMQTLEPQLGNETELQHNEFMFLDGTSQIPLDLETAPEQLTHEIEPQNILKRVEADISLPVNTNDADTPEIMTSSSKNLLDVELPEFDKTTPFQIADSLPGNVPEITGNQLESTISSETVNVDDSIEPSHIDVDDSIEPSHIDADEPVQVLETQLGNETESQHNELSFLDSTSQINVNAKDATELLSTKIEPEPENIKWLGENDESSPLSAVAVSTPEVVTSTLLENLGDIEDQLVDRQDTKTDVEFPKFDEMAQFGMAEGIVDDEGLENEQENMALDENDSTEPSLIDSNVSEQILETQLDNEVESQHNELLFLDDASQINVNAKDHANQLSTTMEPENIMTPVEADLSSPVNTMDVNTLEVMTSSSLLRNIENQPAYGQDSSSDVKLSKFDKVAQFPVTESMQDNLVIASKHAEDTLNGNTLDASTEINSDVDDNLVMPESSESKSIHEPHISNVNKEEQGISALLPEAEKTENFENSQNQNTPITEGHQDLFQTDDIFQVTIQKTANETPSRVTGAVEEEGFKSKITEESGLEGTVPVTPVDADNNVQLKDSAKVNPENDMPMAPKRTKKKKAPKATQSVEALENPDDSSFIDAGFAAIKTPVNSEAQENLQEIFEAGSAEQSANKDIKQKDYTAAEFGNLSPEDGLGKYDVNESPANNDLFNIQVHQSSETLETHDKSKIGDGDNECLVNSDKLDIGFQVPKAEEANSLSDVEALNVCSAEEAQLKEAHGSVDNSSCLVKNQNTVPEEIDVLNKLDHINQAGNRIDNLQVDENEDIGKLSSSDEGSMFGSDQMNISDLDETSTEEVVAGDNVSQISLEFDDNPFASVPMFPQGKMTTIPRANVPKAANIVPSTVFINPNDFEEENEVLRDEYVDLTQPVNEIFAADASLISGANSLNVMPVASQGNFVSFDSDWEEFQQNVKPVNTLPVIEEESEPDEDVDQNVDDEANHVAKQQQLANDRDVSVIAEEDRAYKVDTSLHAISAAETVNIINEKNKSDKEAVSSTLVESEDPKGSNGTDLDANSDANSTTTEGSWCIVDDAGDVEDLHKHHSNDNSPLSEASGSALLQPSTELPEIQISQCYENTGDNATSNTTITGENMLNISQSTNEMSDESIHLSDESSIQDEENTTGEIKCLMEVTESQSIDVISLNHEEKMAETNESLLAEGQEEVVDVLDVEEKLVVGQEAGPGSILQSTDIQKTSTDDQQPSGDGFDIEFVDYSNRETNIVQERTDETHLNVVGVSNSILLDDQEVGTSLLADDTTTETSSAVPCKENDPNELSLAFEGSKIVSNNVNTIQVEDSNSEATGDDLQSQFSKNSEILLEENVSVKELVTTVELSQDFETGISTTNTIYLDEQSTTEESTSNEVKILSIASGQAEEEGKEDVMESSTVCMNESGSLDAVQYSTEISADDLIDSKLEADKVVAMPTPNSFEEPPDYTDGLHSETSGSSQSNANPAEDNMSGNFAVRQTEPSVENDAFEIGDLGKDVEKGTPNYLQVGDDNTSNSGEKFPPDNSLIGTTLEETQNNDQVVTSGSQSMLMPSATSDDNVLEPLSAGMILKKLHIPDDEVDMSGDEQEFRGNRVRYDTIGSIDLLTDSEEEEVAEDETQNSVKEELVSIDLKSELASHDEDGDVPSSRSGSLRRRSIVPPSALVLSIALDEVKVQTPTTDDIKESVSSTPSESEGSNISSGPEKNAKETLSDPEILVPIKPSNVTEQPIWETVVIGNTDYKIDGRAIQNYKRVISHGGFYKEKSAIVEIFGRYLPENNISNYVWVMDNLFLYLLATLEMLVQNQDFVVVFFNGSVSKNHFPSTAWLKKSHQQAPYYLRKNLKGFYVIQSSFYFKTLTGLTRMFLSRKAFKKIKNVKNHKELKQFIPTDFLFIPQDIASTAPNKLNRQVNKSWQWWWAK